MAAVTQLRNRHSVGRTYYDRKINEGMSPKTALRALKRRVSDALYKAMINDAVDLAVAVYTAPARASVLAAMARANRG